MIPCTYIIPFASIHLQDNFMNTGIISCKVFCECIYSLILVILQIKYDGHPLKSYVDGEQQTSVEKIKGMLFTITDKP